MVADCDLLTNWMEQESTKKGVDDDVPFDARDMYDIVDWRQCGEKNKTSTKK